MIDKNERYEYLATITNDKGENIESFIFTSKSEGDTVFWNIRHLIDFRYNINICYLGIKAKPRRLKKVSL